MAEYQSEIFQAIFILNELIANKKTEINNAPYRADDNFSLRQELRKLRSDKNKIEVLK